VAGELPEDVASAHLAEEHPEVEALLVEAPSAVVEVLPEVEVAVEAAGAEEAVIVDVVAAEAGVVVIAADAAVVAEHSARKESRSLLAPRRPSFPAP